LCKIKILKKQDTKYQMIAKTFFGLEEVLSDELKNIGAKDIQPLNRAVSFYGDLSIMYKANYLCYTAIRILKPIANFLVSNEEDLYNEVKKIPWWNYMDIKQTLAIDAVLSYSHITHSKFAALKTKDAIVDVFRDKFGERPSVDTIKPDLRINIHIFKENCTVSIDSSGDSLHKRGYRIAVDKAPLNEVLAAGLIKLSAWDGKTNLIDPMCGSGTILIEAALQGFGIPAGYYRKDFGFTHWKDFDAALWKQIQKDALNNQKDFEHRIIGSDHSYKAINIAQENLKNAKLHKDIELNKSTFEDLNIPVKEGVLISNPPYDERLEEADIKGLYQMIGDQFKIKLKGFNAWILSGNLQVLKFVGLRPSRKIIVYNGPIECRFAKYEIYDGSRKASKMNNQKEKSA
jgi:putative N6-adenine-specific DNA methylase